MFSLKQGFIIGMPTNRVFSILGCMDNNWQYLFDCEKDLESTACMPLLKEILKHFKRGPKRGDVSRVQRNSFLLFSARAGGMVQHSATKLPCKGSGCSCWATHDWQGRIQLAMISSIQSSGATNSVLYVMVVYPFTHSETNAWRATWPIIGKEKFD